MKGLSGIVVAICLGVAGALANLYYLHSESQKTETVSFVGVKKGIIIGRGERLVEDNLVEVKIPKDTAANLRDYACPWNALKSVTNMAVWRALDSSEGAILLLWSDIKTPHKELELGKGEHAAYVALPRNVVTSQINPGDKVSFKFWSTTSAPGPTRASKEIAPPTTPEDLKPPEGTAAPTPAADPAPKPEAAEAAAYATSKGETPIGPFVVMSIGNRLDSTEVMKAAKIPQIQENVLVIRISKNVPGEQQMYDKLAQMLHSAGSNSFDLILDGKE